VDGEIRMGKKERVTLENEKFQCMWGFCRQKFTADVRILTETENDITRVLGPAKVKYPRCGNDMVVNDRYKGVI
jgi:hypothetical protein